MRVKCRPSRRRSTRLRWSRRVGGKRRLWRQDESGDNHEERVAVERKPPGSSDEICPPPARMLGGS